MPSAYKVGARIKELRKRRGWTQDELARKVRLSRIYIAQLEAGDRVSPSFTALKRIARALKARLRVDLENG
jgi:transcriptional regulator with XRE-family HTH domain